MSLGRILAIDYGSVNIGLALSDEMQIIAQGLPTVKNNDEFFTQLKSIIDEHHVVEIAVGFPLNMNGSVGAKAEEVLAFCEKLRTLINIPVETTDERLTTMQAERTLLSGGAKRKKRRKVNDKIAAQLILQNYLSLKSNQRNGI